MRDTLDIILTRALSKMLNDSDCRSALWYLLTVILHVEDAAYQHNAAAYSLLAKQEAGKLVLAAMKDVSLDLTHKAEQDYINITSIKEGDENA